MNENFTDKVAVVLGGSQGCGRAAAKMYAKGGAKVVLAALDDEFLPATAQEIRDEGGTVLAVPYDARSTEQTNAVFDRALAEFGKVDIVAIFAGRNDGLVPVERITDEVVEDVYNVNVFGSIRATRKAFECFGEKGGVIVYVASASHERGIGGVAYTSSKHALVCICQHTAAMGMKRNIRANVVCPGAINTTFNTPEDIAAYDKECLDMLIEHVAPAPATEPEDIANAVIFLSSDDSRTWNGTVSNLDFGSGL